MGRVLTFCEAFPDESRRTAKQFVEQIQSMDRWDECCIDFNTIWPLCGYSQKGHGKVTLQSKRLGLRKGLDYSIKEVDKISHRQKILLTADAALKFGSMAKGDVAGHFVDFLLEMKSIVDEAATHDCEIDRKKRYAHTILHSDLDRFLKRKRVKSTHNEIRDRIAQELEGDVERQNEYGVCDVESAETVVEVAPLHEIKHGIGQAICYAKGTGKTARLHVYGGDPPEPGYFEICNEHGISLTYEIVDTRPS